jgi:hypothetical protein
MPLDHTRQTHPGKGKATQLPVNLATVPNSEKVDFLFRRVERINNSIVPDAQSKTITALKAMMRKIFRTNAHIVNASLNAILHLLGKGDEGTIETGINIFALRSRRLRLARSRTKPLLHLCFGFANLILEMLREFKLILNKVVEKIANFTQLFR